MSKNCEFAYMSVIFGYYALWNSGFVLIKLFDFIDVDVLCGSTLLGFISDVTDYSADNFGCKETRRPPQRKGNRG